MLFRSLLILATAATLFHASDADAGRYRHHHYHTPRYRPHVPVVLIPTKIYIGASLTAGRVLHQGSNASTNATAIDNGVGLVLFSGVRMNPHLALEASWIGTVHDRSNGDDIGVLNGLTGDARVYLGPGQSNLEPFIQGGFGMYILNKDSFGNESMGFGFQGGGGVDVILGRRLKLGARVLYRGLTMSSVATDAYIGIVTAEANLSLQF